MVYVLGILTLVALIGLILIAKTHGASKRVAGEATAVSYQAAANGIVRVIQETLHRDIWGPTGSALRPLSGDSATGIQETNEPFDAPGSEDRWLSSSYPYHVGRRTANTYPSLVEEEQVLVWHRVSYLGSDVLQPAGENGYSWAYDRRTTDPGASVYTATTYGDRSLESVPVLQTPIPGWENVPLIPGSTTNVTIAEARRVWNATDAALFNAAGQVRRFPYFDTNADGQVDLYDADGDGVPDSPISLVIPLDTADPNAPRQLYAVVRIIDHAAMLNVNVASSLSLPAGGHTFNEVDSDFQRRGRRVTDLLLDEVVHADDSFTAGNRTAGLMNYRSGSSPAQFDRDVVRSRLVGDWFAGGGYFLYGMDDEASLRHRWLLAPYEFRDFNKAAASADYRTIDRALRGTLLWTREVDSANSYLTSAARWNRLNADYQPPTSTTHYEGYDQTGGKLGWRTLLQEDDPAAIRRPFFTTVSREVVPPPAGLALDATGGAVMGLSGVPVRLVRGGVAGAEQFMFWPVLPRNSPDPDVQRLPDWMRIQRVELNFSVAGGDVEAVKEAYIAQMAAVFYKALEGVRSYQGIPLSEDLDPSGPLQLNRQQLSWQFAINAADFRDSDAAPTILEWEPVAGQRRYLFGIEKQPFFTEAYAYLVAGDIPGGPGGSNNPPVPDQWFYAVELYVPPYWNLPINNLYIRTPGVVGTNWRPLSGFRRGGSTPPTLQGGANGSYLVLCGSTDVVPDDLDPLDLATFYRDSGFKLATDGSGRVELVYSPDGVEGNPLNHVLDVIGPSYSGGLLAGGTASGQGGWAKRPNDIMPGGRKAFSLLRSTQGWRFTTAWQVYSEAPLGANLPNNPPLRRSLGGVNNTRDSLDANIPESVWPTLVTTLGSEAAFPDAGGALVPGFVSGMPYEAFDSIGDLSRLFVIGPDNHRVGVTRLLPGFGLDDVPVTGFLGRILDAGPTGDLPIEPGQRVAAGRVDFVDAIRVGDSPWTWRLFDYLTTQSLLHDGIDNDADGLVDLEDPTEAAAVLYRVAGRININTAPASVLRSVPYLSVLPTSPTYERFINNGTPVADPVSAYVASPTDFWDLASAIVATRERRAVPVRLPDGTGALTTVAVAQRTPVGGGNTPAYTRGAFASVAELAGLTTILDNLNGNFSGGNNALFNVQRFWSGGPSGRPLPLWNHKVQAGDPDLGDPPAGLEGFAGLSPDYRYRRETGAISYVPIAPIQHADGNVDVGGIRARDIFLSRWANLLTTRSDVFTAYVSLLDEDGNYVHRVQVILDRGECFREVPAPAGGSLRRLPVMPRVLLRVEGSHTNDMQ